MTFRFITDGTAKLGPSQFDSAFGGDASMMGGGRVSETLQHTFANDRRNAVIHSGCGCVVQVDCG